MRDTAERALAEAVDTSAAVQPYFVGNAPAGHVELGERGTLFFHRCAALGLCGGCTHEVRSSGVVMGVH